MMWPMSSQWGDDSYDQPDAARQKAGTQVEAGTGGTPQRVERTNKVLSELLKDGRAEVTDLSLRDVANLSNELGWQGVPNFDFEGDAIYVSKPGRRRSAKAAGSPQSSGSTPSTTPPAGVGG